MPHPAWLALLRMRAEARREAEEELAALEFELTDDGTWLGALRPEGGPRLRVRVVLPEGFPEALPQVLLVSPDDLPRQFAHVVRSGGICIVQPSGVLFDTSRPRALVHDSLRKARRELERGYSGESDVELQTEFDAYWELSDRVGVISICHADGSTREILGFLATGFSFLKDSRVVFADSRETAEEWLSNLAAKYDQEAEIGALFVRLERGFAPPGYDTFLTVHEVRDLVGRNASAADARWFEERLETNGLPITLVLSMPQPGGLNRLLVGIRLNAPSDAVRKRVRMGFRPGKIPNWRVLREAANQAVGHFRIQRFDGVYLRARGGAATALATSRVVIAGVGAVGSQMANQLAALGVGALKLVDPDDMAAENVHRHALGVIDVGYTKATGVHVDLRRRFPHQAITSHGLRIDDLLCDDTNPFAGTDLHVFALGDETVERRLNLTLSHEVATLHVWTEPLGIGGHALLVVPGRPGCFECLFDIDLELGPYNTAALTQPGQTIHRTMAGCVGIFTPFSVLDATRAALEGSDVAARFLAGSQVDSTLVSWRGTHTEFEASGLTLSQRSRVVLPGQRYEVTGAEFRRGSCPRCSAIVNG